VLNGKAGELVQKFNPVGAIHLVLSIAVIALLVVFYFFPSIIGKRRDMLYIHALFITDLALGWTVIGWILCVLWVLFGLPLDAHFAIRSAVAKPQSRWWKRTKRMTTRMRAREVLEHLVNVLDFENLVRIEPSGIAPLVGMAAADVSASLYRLASLGAIVISVDNAGIRARLNPDFGRKPTLAEHMETHRIRLVV
jgi:Superinfection immunity protein